MAQLLSAVYSIVCSIILPIIGLHMLMTKITALAHGDGQKVERLATLF